MNNKHIKNNKNNPFNNWNKLLHHHLNTLKILVKKLLIMTKNKSNHLLLFEHHRKISQPKLNKNNKRKMKSQNIKKSNKNKITMMKIKSNKMMINSIMSSNNKLKNHKDSKKITSFTNKLLNYQNKTENTFIIKLYNPIMSLLHTSKDSPVDSLKSISSVEKIIDHYCFVKIKEVV